MGKCNFCQQDSCIAPDCEKYKLISAAIDEIASWGWAVTRGAIKAYLDYNHSLSGLTWGEVDEMLETQVELKEMVS